MRLEESQRSPMYLRMLEIVSVHYIVRIPLHYRIADSQDESRLRFVCVGSAWREVGPVGPGPTETCCSHIFIVVVGWSTS